MGSNPERFTFEAASFSGAVRFFQFFEIRSSSHKNRLSFVELLLAVWLY